MALIHAQEVAGEERGLVAAGAGPDFEDDAALVGSVLRQQGDEDLAGARLDLGAGRVALLIGEVAELGIGGGIGDQRLGLFQRGLRLTPGRDCRDHGIEFGQFLRELDGAYRLGGVVDLVGRGGMARHDDVETILGELERHSMNSWKEREKRQRRRNQRR